LNSLVKSTWRVKLVRMHKLHARIPYLLAFTLLLGAPSFAKDKDKADKKADKGKTAVIETTAGNITVKLFPDKAPKTVENFIGLATGKKEWTDPKTDKKVKRPLYNGTIFHRVIPDFMIQGGDPMGTGAGGPGYTFEDEVSSSDSFD